METPIRIYRRDHRSPHRDLVDDSSHYHYRIRGYQCLWCSHYKSIDWRDNFCSNLASINLPKLVSSPSLFLPAILRRMMKCDVTFAPIDTCIRKVTTLVC